MIHLPVKRLNDSSRKYTSFSNEDFIIETINSLTEVCASIQDDLLSTSIISNLYLDMSSPNVQFICKLELLYGVTYNEFKKEIERLSRAIELGIIERRYSPNIQSIKRLHPYENNLIVINLMLLDITGNLIHRRF